MQKGIHSVRAVVNIATENTDKYWAQIANSMSKNELELFVKETREKEDDKLKNNTQETLKLISDHPIQPQFKTIVMHLKPEVAARLEKLNSSDWNILMEKFLVLYEKNLENTKPEVIKEASRNIPRKVKNYILKRSNGKCEFPSCNKPYKHLHHTERFAINRSHDPDKMVALCKEHHLLAHQGLISNENKQIKSWNIRYQPDQASPNRFVDDKVQFYRRI